MPAEIIPEIYSVHEAAEVYPMLGDDRLQDLADSIKQDGMHFPIIFTTDEHGEPVLVDGRNRLAAAGIAGVHPKIEWRDFDDDDAIRRFIYAASERRDISAGQRAMSAALIWPDAEPGEGGWKGIAEVSNGNLSTSQLSKARTILEYQPDLVPLVMRGADPMPFSKAYKDAMAQKRIANAGVERVQKIDAHIKRIRATDNDIADMLVSGHIELDDALKQVDEIDRAAKASMVSACLQAGKTEGLMLLLDRESSRDILRRVEREHADLLKEHAYTTPKKMRSDMGALQKALTKYLNEE